jgi:hypothetical protein
MMEALWNWRTTGLKWKERIPDLDPEDILPLDRAGGVDSAANRPTGAPPAAWMTKKRAQKNFRRKSLVTP